MDVSSVLTTISHSLLPIGQQQQQQQIDGRPPPLSRPYLDTKPERNLWREQEMLQLLDIMRSLNAVELLNDKTVRSETVFRNIEKLMHNYGYRKKTYMQIWTKWKFLKSTYMTSRRAGTIPKVIPVAVYESLHELLNVTSTMSNNNNNNNNNSMDSSILTTNGLLINDCSNVSGSIVDCNNDGITTTTTPPTISTITTTTKTTTTTNYVNGNNNTNLNDKNDSMDDDTSYTASLSHDEAQIMIANVQGGVPCYGKGVVVRKKIKAPTIPILTTSNNDINGFGVQHPIFGYRLGIVKQEPIEPDFEDNSRGSNPIEDENSSFPCSPSADMQFEPQIKMETVSPPPIDNCVVSPAPPMPPLHISPYLASRFDPKEIYHTQHNDNNATSDTSFTIQLDRPPPALKRFSNPVILPKIELTTTRTSPPITPQPHNLPRLKHVPLRRITLQPRKDPPYARSDGPLSPPTTNSSNNSSNNTQLDGGIPATTTTTISEMNKKIPVLTLRKRSRRLRIPMTFNDEPCPYSKEDDDDDNDDNNFDDPISIKQKIYQNQTQLNRNRNQNQNRTLSPSTSPHHIPQSTSQKYNIPSTSHHQQATASASASASASSYNKAMRDLSSSLRTMQRELIDDFFAKQMQLARDEHEFQKRQDEMLLQCYEKQTQIIMNNVKLLLGKKNSNATAN